MAEIYGKKSILELDLVNDVLMNTSASVTLDDGTTTIPKYHMAPEFMERFVESLDSFWHTEKDQLEAISFYEDGSTFCQRKKLKYDFASGQKVYSTYTFTGFTQEQSDALQQRIRDFFAATEVIKELKINQYIGKIDKEYLLFDKTYLKRVREKNDILTATDWRILPDVVDSYEGEKDLWIKYRQEVRSLVLKEPSNFASGLEFFKYIITLKWPIDPKGYRELYPGGLDVNGNAVEYLSTDTQWVERETDSSRDLVESRLGNIISMRQNYLSAERRTTKVVKDIMKELRLEDFIESGIDYSKIYTEDDLEELTE
ncbi:hypothetical protein T040910_032 [Synechococcus phage S-CAM3]|uniref:Uncharacterized protein n=1 Tax=Synechococcus phage S-CAM3 TaxID=1883366 RepID=A0A1D8KJF7_9CAUD|nr:tail assembly chaperone [Synechococcus phage S-CAM3]AOV58537.1 hypothetical protein S250808_032 [Synechococcus phage S-CAM3]AOV58776.1 hypothetical protein T040910_032 [Synechococcus phage S-CAM3]AOV59015.1 hypothetical protein C421010_032 [Synechococcus phage S-CAM3]